jgi:hypothetical protein
MAELTKGQLAAAERSKKAYEESPYKDRERDSHMRNNFNSMLNTAGAGRGGQGGPTAKELADYERKQDAGVFTEGKKMPPSPREMAKGGKVGSASKRADGIATKGKTRGTIVMCGGGMSKGK